LLKIDLNPRFRFPSKCQWLWVAVVEDNELSRELLIRQIDRGLGLRCAGAYPTGEEALAEIPRSNAEVVLMDIRLPGMNGIECTRRLLRLLPALHIVVLTENEEHALVFEALRAGAHGYLLREHTSPGELHKALTDVMTGGSPISSQIARKVIRHFQQPNHGAGWEKLTPRERQVMEGLADSWRYKEIADQLCISLDTARNHIRSIYEKLHVHSRTEAVVNYMGR